MRNKNNFKNHDDFLFQMKALNQTSFFSLSRLLGSSEVVRSARRWQRPPSLLRAELWQDVGCKVLHINLFTAVLVTLIIRHGSSSHIERGSSARIWAERGGNLLGERRESYKHIYIYIYGSHNYRAFINYGIRRIRLIREERV